MKIGLRLFVLLGLATGACTQGKEAPTLAGEAATTSAEVSVALVPKLRVGLRYRIEIVSEWENHRGVQPRKVGGRRFVKVEILRKSGAGYLMSWEYGPFSLTGATRESPAEGSLRPDMIRANRPIDGVRLEFFVNARGVPLELDNAPQVSAHLKKTDPRMAEAVDSGSGMRIFDEPPIFYALSGRIVAGGAAHKYAAAWWGVRGVRAEGHLLLREVAEGGTLARVASQLFPDAAWMRQAHGSETRVYESAEHEFDLAAGRPRSVVHERVTLDGDSPGTVIRHKFRILAD